MSRNQLTITELDPWTVIAPLALSAHLHADRFHCYQADPNEEGMFEAGWQAVEAQVSQRTELTSGYRSSSEAKSRQYELVALGAALGQSVAMMIMIAPASKLEIDICVEVRPPKHQTYLPANLQLMVMDQAGDVILDAQVGSNNQHVQLEFTGEPGDRFGIKVALGNVSVTEDFVI